MTLADQLANYAAGASSPIEGEAPRAPTAEELARHVVAPGEAALLPAGIEYQAAWQSASDGFARHARMQALALAAAGLPVVLRPLGQVKDLLDVESPYIDSDFQAAIDLVARAYPEARDLTVPRPHREVRHLVQNSIARTVLAIRHVILGSPQALESIVAPPGARLAGLEVERQVYRSTIVYTSWERSTVSQDLVDVLNRLAGVWVPCRMNARVFERAGVKNVSTFPCPYDPKTSLPIRFAEPFGSTRVPDGKRFYSIGKWEPRKNYHALVGAFLTAFKATDRVSLFIKTSPFGPWKDYPSPAESLARWTADPAVLQNGWTEKKVRERVVIADAIVPEHTLMELHRTNNIYVSASHGEAWDLPAFDAKLAGNRLVYAGWGGPEDYAEEEDVCILDEPWLTAVEPEYGWEPDAKWAAVPIGDIGHALRVAAPPRTRRVPARFYGRYSLAAVGEAMRNALHESGVLRGNQEGFG